MTQDSNAGERNEPENEAPRELTPAELKAQQEAQDMADGHRYIPQEMRDARDAKPERPKKPAKSLKEASSNSGERIAKVLARAGLASRREIERLIGLGKIAVNGRILETPAVLVKASDVITVDGQVIGKAEPTRLWRYHKPVGLVTTERDPEGRPTVFDKLPSDLPRVLKVGRLDLNSEGLLLLTNDGELARALELPSSGWVRRYRARALGHTTQARLDTLKDGTTVDGVIYGPIEATLDKVAEKADGRANVWITVAITEGKNREVRKVLESLGLKVNRLIRLAYGPFQLGNLDAGEVEEVGPRVIRELLSDLVPLKNLPPEGASQTRSKPASRFSRDKSADGREDGKSGPPGRRGGGDRFGDKPKAFSKDKPRRDFAEKREYKERDFDQRPRFEGDGEARDRRPTTDSDFVPKPRFNADRPKRDYGDRPRQDRPQGARPSGDRPAFKKPYTSRDGAPPAGEAGAYERAKREFGKPEGGRPKRDYGDKPRGAKLQSDRPQGDRPAFKKPYAARDDAGGERSYADRPKRDFGDRPRQDRPQGERPAFKKSYAPRDGAAGGERKSYGDRPGYKPRDSAPRDGESRGGKRDYASRDGAERKSYGDKPRSSSPRGEGFKSDRPRSEWPAGGGFKGAPRGDRPTGGRPGGKPGGRPSGGKPFKPRD